MEPCPYRQGERTRRMHCSATYSPQWSPALIGRERLLYAVDGRRRDGAAMEPCPYRQGERMPPYTPTRSQPITAAMEPCPYRQGEGPAYVGPLHRDDPPQWSPALIGRESYRRVALPLCCLTRPQWSPALIGRESRADGYA